MQPVRLVPILILFAVLSGSCFINAQNQSALRDGKDKNFHTQHKSNRLHI